MFWIITGVLTALLFALMDLITKIMGKSISVYLSAFLMNFIAAVVLFLYLIFQHLAGKNPFYFTNKGIILSSIAGVVNGASFVFFIFTLTNTPKISLASPLVRILTVIIAVVLGFLVLKEQITLKYIVGFLISIIGLYLLISS